MKKLILPSAFALVLATALVLLLIAAPAQSQQQQLDARHDRALAAGYKALMLCSAVANAERGGVTRTAQSVHVWELAGIQAPLNDLVQDMPYAIMRAANGTGVLSFVQVEWADDMPPRIAYHKAQNGCALGPIGMKEPPGRIALPRAYPDAIVNDHTRIIPAEMAPAFDQAFSGEYGAGTRTTAVIVSGKDGDGFWRYADDFGPATPQRTWSVAKSIAATLVGASVQRGEGLLVLDPKDGSALQPPLPILDWYGGDPVDGPNQPRVDQRSAIAMNHLLRMASGRYSDTPGNRTDPLYFGGSTVSETALHWPLIAQPGSVFRYANNDTLAAVAAIASTFKDHPPSAFFAHLDMENTVAETDWQGDFILSSQVWSTAPDLMRFGQLYLNDGVADGVRILPEGWVQYVSAPTGPQPENSPFGYGAGFWLMNNSEGIPADTFAAFGNRGQYVVIVPSRDVVIVRRGEDPAGSRFDIAAFTRDVLSALDQ